MVPVTTSNTSFIAHKLQMKAPEPVQAGGELKGLLRGHLASLSRPGGGAEAQIPSLNFRPPFAALQSRNQLQMAGSLTQGRLQQTGCMSIRDLARKLDQAEVKLQGLGVAAPLLAGLDEVKLMLDGSRALGLPPGMSTKAALSIQGGASQCERLLHALLSAPGPEVDATAGQGQAEAVARQFEADTRKIFAELLAGLQGIPGGMPAGYQAAAIASPPRPSEGARQSRLEEAEKLRSQEPPKSVPRALGSAVGVLLVEAGSEASKAATPAPKASGPGQAEWQDKVLGLLERAQTPQEAKKLAAMLGGPDLKNKIQDEKGLDRLEALAKKFEMPALGFGQSGKAVLEKRKQIDDLLKEIDNPPTRPSVWGGGVEADFSALDASKKKLAQLVEDKNFLGLASPEQKAGMIKALRTHVNSVPGGGGFAGLVNTGETPALVRTGELAPPDLAQAAYKVLASCTSKAEFDKTIDLAGGKELLRSVPGAPLQERSEAEKSGMGSLLQVPAHYQESLNKLNELAGSWGRTDVATDKARAEKFEGVLLEPRRSELSATRPPTAAEVGSVGADLDETGNGDPAAGKLASAVKKGMADRAFDVDWDPQAKTELALEQRRRELDGKPKLDLTSLTAEAERILHGKAPESPKPDASTDNPKASAGVFLAVGTVSKSPELIKEEMTKLAEKHGLSEQTMKSLVTQRMGQIRGQASGEMEGIGKHIGSQWKQQLAEIEKTKGKDSPEAKALRERVEKFEQTTGASAQQLGQTAGIYASMFPVPPPPPPEPSFWDKLGSALGSVLDVAASVLKVVPGYGQAAANIYSALKGLANGDLVGGLTGLGATVAGAGLKEGFRFAQSAQKGDVLGGLGNLSKDLGGAIGDEAIKLGRSVDKGDWKAVASQAAQGAAMLAGAGGAAGQVAQIVQKGLELARAGEKLGNGIANKDFAGILEGMAAGAGAASGVGGEFGKAAGEFGKFLDYGRGAAMAIQGAANGNLEQMLAGANTLGGGLSGALAKDPALASIVQNPIVQNAMKHAPAAANLLGAVASGNVSGVLATFSTELAKLPGMSPEVNKALGLASDGAKIADALQSGDYSKAFGGVSSQLQQMGLGPEATTLRRSLDSIPDLLRAVGSGDPLAVAQALGGKDGFLQSVGGGGLTQGIAGLSDVAGKALGSPQLRQASDLAQAGTRFFSAMGSGDLNRTINAVAGLNPALGKAASQVSALANAGAPLARSMASGQFQQALGELRKNELTSGFADRLAPLGTISDLVTGRAQESLRSLQQSLRQTYDLRKQLDKFEDLERFTQDLDKRFVESSELAVQELLLAMGSQQQS